MQIFTPRATIQYIDMYRRFLLLGRQIYCESGAITALNKDLT